MARLFNQFRHLPTPKFDLRKTLSRFESFADVIERKKAIVKVLRKGNRADRCLAKKLRKCKKDRRCLSGACPVCRRRMRMWFFGEIQEVFKVLADEQVIHLTIICPKLQFEPNELNTMIPRNVVNRLTTILRRLKFTDEVILGALDYDWCVDDNKCAEGYWQVHYHLICPSLSKAQLDALRKVLPNKPASYIPRAIVSKSIKARTKQFSYVLKPFFRERSSFVGDDGKRRTKKGRIKNAYLRRELFRHLDQHPLTDSLVLFRARRAGGDIRPAEFCR